MSEPESPRLPAVVAPTKAALPKGPSYLPKLGIGFLSGVVLYTLLSLTPDRQWALAVACVGGFFAFVVPLAQTEFGRRMDWRDAQRFAQEQAQLRKAPNLRAIFYDGSSIEFWPIGGHQLRPIALTLHVYTENFGDAPASDVIVSLGLPPMAQQVLLTEQTTQVVNEQGELVTIPMNSDTDKQIIFRWNQLPNGLEGQTGNVELQRPLYPNQTPRPLGRVAVILPPGTHRIAWVIESSGGTFCSTDDDALVVTQNGTAVGHDPVQYGQQPEEHCRNCHAMVRLRTWMLQVDAELNKHRIATLQTNPNRIPRMMTSPAGVQWYQQWTGPHRWVTCDVLSGEVDSVRAVYWTQGDWEHGDVRTVSMDVVAPFADDVWEFLKPVTDEG
jgi:hypothetical protein